MENPGLNPLLETYLRSFHNAAIRDEPNTRYHRMRTQRLRLAFSLLLLTFSASQVFAQEVGREATRCFVTVFNVDSNSTRVVFESDRRFDAPSWSADGSYLILNSGGKLWQVPVNGG